MKQTQVNYRSFLCILFLLLSFQIIEGQTIVVNDPNDDETSYTPQQLVQDVLISGNCATATITETNLFEGSVNGTIGKSYGYFRREPGSPFPFEEGLVLSTSDASQIGVGGVAGLGFNAEPPMSGDADNVLFNIINAFNNANGIPPITSLNNANSIEFEFVPTTDVISFRYIMASEEYQGAFPCSFADAFGFLLKRQGVAEDFVNIAVVPDTAPPVPVAVTTVHEGFGCAQGDQNPAYYAGFDNDTNFEGRTEILTATATVIPGETYIIRLVIADANDSDFDSAVFLEAGSFNLGLNLGEDFVSADDKAVCGTEIELTANIAANEYRWLKDDVVIPGETGATYTANLGDGVYSCEITDGTDCTARDDIIIEFEEPAAINPVIDEIQVCDADGDLTEIFDLTTKDTEILNGQDPTTFEVRYFTDDAYTNQIANPTAFANTTPIQTIYARVVNKNSTNCAADNSFTIEVTGLPVPTIPVDYEICDDDTDGDDTDGVVQTFILSTKDAEILGILDPAQYTVSYHTTLIGAQTSNTSDVIDKNDPYTNTIPNSQQIFVRVENVDNVACNSSDVSFNLIVSVLPSPLPLVELQQCDDNTDGFSDFNLFEAGQNISPDNFMNETFEFFETEADAIAGMPTINNPTAYTNQNPTTDTVWARTISAFGCYRVSQVNLIVATNSTVVTNFPVQTFEDCDDFLDEEGNDTMANDDTDGITMFNFSEVTSAIVDEFPPSEQPFLAVDYYRNEADALAESNAIENDGAAYRNIGYPGTQQIYVRVDNTLNNDCIGIVPLITLNVLPVPSAREVEDLRLCDNGDDGEFDNGIVQTFNLDAQTPIILDGQDPNQFTVTYHVSAAEALSGVNAIISTDAYTNIVPSQQTIFVRVQNNTTECFTNHTSFELFVDELPVANEVTNLEICDTLGPPVDGSAQNGISTFINLHSKTLDILNGQDPNQFTVTYHTSIANAQNGVNPVGGTLDNPTSFTNSVPFLQTIYVRVVNGDTGCANDISDFDIIVHPEPETFEISNISICDDGVPGDDPNLSGVVETFQLDDVIGDILGDDQNESDFTVTFHETITQAQEGTDALISPYTNTMAFEQDIFVRVVNNTTGCVNDDFTFKIFVKPLPVFEVTTPQIVCLNGPELTLSVENPLTIYDYTWTTPTGDTFNGPQITITQGEGIYSVEARTTDDDDVVCSYTQEIFVQESIIATLTQADVIIEDESSSNTITIDPTNLGIGDYEYALLNDQGFFVGEYQDSPVFDGLPGGIYTILARDKNGCGVASLDVPVVEYPKFFTPNNDGQNDTWTIKGANSTFFPGSEVNVFNRFGKLVARVDLDSAGWDGTFNGTTLPSDDYWFSVKLFDRDGNPVKEMVGNVSLLRK